MTLTIRGGSQADVSALASFSETIAGETLAKTISIDFAEDPELDAAMHSTAGSQRSTLSAGQFSNAGVLVIDVWKSETTDV